MKDLLYDEFDFSQYDPLANINAILEEIAQKNLDIEEIATTMEYPGNATPEKVVQIDIIEQEIQELKKRADYYLAHLTKLWHDRLWEDIYNIASTARGVEADNNTIRVEFDSRGFNYAQIELNAINKLRCILIRRHRLMIWCAFAPYIGTVRLRCLATMIHDIASKRRLCAMQWRADLARVRQTICAARWAENRPKN